jgi:D-glycero-D-manno-heptose 1,7-bisphosphate phosphatase
MPESLRRAAFLDRDGVINVETGYLYRIEDFAFVDGAVEGMHLLASAGYALVVVTNQAGIAKGLYDEAAYQRLTQHMLDELSKAGVAVTAVYHCPHHPLGVVPAYAMHCLCRKPGAGMLLAAAGDHRLDLKRSVLIGDKTSDSLAGRAAGLPLTILVETGHALPTDAMDHADRRCADLKAAARWLVDRQTPGSVQP